jgi:hypothetical protein
MMAARKEAEKQQELVVEEPEEPVTEETTVE